MNEKIIIEKVVNILSEIENLNVQSMMDFQTPREDNQCVVGIARTEQLNPGTGCPDYQYDMEILLNCGIAEDNSGDEFYSLCSAVKMRLLPFELNRNELETLFENMPIVYFQFVDQAFSVSERSNLCTLRYKIIASY